MVSSKFRTLLGLVAVLASLCAFAPAALALGNEDAPAAQPAQGAQSDVPNTWPIHQQLTSNGCTDIKMCHTGTAPATQDEFDQRAAKPSARLFYRLSAAKQPRNKRSTFYPKFQPRESPGMPLADYQDSSATVA